MEKEIATIRAILIRMDKTLVVNTKSLEEHIKRTELLEKQLKPVSAHVEQMRGAGKLLGLLALIATIASIIMVFK